MPLKPKYEKIYVKKAAEKVELKKFLFFNVSEYFPPSSIISFTFLKMSAFFNFICPAS